MVTKHMLASIQFLNLRLENGDPFFRYIILRRKHQKFLGDRNIAVYSVSLCPYKSGMCEKWKVLPFLKLLISKFKIFLLKDTSKTVKFALYVILN